MGWSVHFHSVRKEWAVIDDNMKLVIPVYYFLKARKGERYAQNSLKAYATDLMHLYRFLNKRGLDITTMESSDIEDFKEWLMFPRELRDSFDSSILVLNKKAAITGSSWNRILSTLEEYITWLHIRNTPLSKSIMKLTHLREQKRKGKGRRKGKKGLLKVNDMEKQPEYIPPDKRNEIRGHLAERDQLIFDFFYFSGMRIGEALSFRVSSFTPKSFSGSIADIELEDSLEERLDLQTKTGGRTLYLPTPLYQRLLQYRLYKRGRTKSDRLFVTTRNCGKSSKGSPLAPDTFRKNLKRACEKCGASYTPHDLRHTLATDILRATNDISLAQDILGHKSLDTTKKYVHPQDEDIAHDLGGVYTSLYSKLMED
ncbi:site-specific integrase [Sulfurovum sp. XGS-02]|uniref:tyrosine-type recombinase/integrase n=1 Tax=Sulfurovum sp. XGS-02 TaxID=2925411 RepID=UPI00204F23E1|nr:site-specific integrase [Sulfurovum sp. XGS-02]UPT77478.1 site-specific integrase [Sulfurovum sp. XGS-02]